MGLTVVFRQSNHEGELVDWIQEARTKAAGVILNAGRLHAHLGGAATMPAACLTSPLIEVHLSNPFARERFRRHSFISEAATGVICGLGATAICSRSRRWLRSRRSA